MWGKHPEGSLLLWLQGGNSLPGRAQDRLGEKGAYHELGIEQGGGAKTLSQPAEMKLLKYKFLRVEMTDASAKEDPAANQSWDSFS